MAQQLLRRFGAPVGAAGVEVLERSGTNALPDPRFGTIMMVGPLKRGPMGLPVPVESRAQYDEIFGDPRDPNWHIFRDGAHLTPDAIDGFFSNGGGAGRIWVIRLDLEGKARRSEVTLKSRTGADALRVIAANEGRWGGAKNSVATTPVIVATSRTFTLIAPGVESNEFIDAEATFSGVPGKMYRIVANTAADERSGEVVFTVGAQYNLLTDGLSGPVGLSGTAEYSRYSNLEGTAEFPLYQAVTGTVTLDGITVTGTGTQFTTELSVGKNLYIGGEARSIESITSDTTLTVSAPYTSSGTGLSGETDNRTVTGTATTFDVELAPGDTVYANIDGTRQGRTIESINSATELVLTSGFTSALTAGTQLETDNFTVTGTGTAFDTELTAGSLIIDPYRQGAAIRVAAITSDTEIEVETAFSNDFSAAQLAKQTQSGAVDLAAGNATEGLSVEVGQGTRFPETHFSLNVRFNGSLVMQIADASLDPNDPAGLFVEPLVNDSNIAYRTGSTNYQKWITVESLWTSAYTTGSGSDVRPCNGAGKALEVTKERVYTVSDLVDYAASVGNLFYPNPYAQPRNYFRVKRAAAPVTLVGTISSTGTTVTGTSTTFQSELTVGDYLYDPNTDSVRKVVGINSDTSLTLESAFATDVPALTIAKKAGYLAVDQSYDLRGSAAVGDSYLAIHPISLERGYDGDLAYILPYHYTKFADVDRNVLEQAVWGKNHGLIRICCPGVSDVAIQKAYAAYASAKAFEFRCEVPSFYTSSAAAEAFVTQTLGRDDFISVAFPSYGFISNPLAAGDRMVPLSGDIMGGESNYAVTHEGYHFPFAGTNAILSRILKIPIELQPSDEAILNVAGIQPIKGLDGRVVVFGARVPSRSPTYDFLHIRRIQSNYVRIFLEARNFLEQLFQPNQPEVAEQIVMVLNNFSRREHRKGVFSRYLSFAQAVQVSASGSGSNVVSDAQSQDAVVEIINGRLRIYFRYVPTGILERLTIDAGPDILVAQYGNTLTEAGSL